MAFGSALRALRLEKDYSQRELADRAGIDYTYLSKIERGRVAPPSEEVIDKLARHLDADPEELKTLAGKFSRVALKEAAEEDERVALLLRKLQSQQLTNEQLERIFKVARENASGQEESGDS
ncbi:MAG: helix-turn-helix transcriptional regulator [Anaerolineae bacterium]